jgi:hypothetical protein
VPDRDDPALVIKYEILRRGKDLPQADISGVIPAFVIDLAIHPSSRSITITTRLVVGPCSAMMNTAKRALVQICVRGATRPVEE